MTDDDKVLADVMRRLIAQCANATGYTVGGGSGASTGERAPLCRCGHRLARHDRAFACTEPACGCTGYAGERR